MNNTSTQNGTYLVGKNLTRRPATVMVSFPQPFIEPPIIHATTVNEGDNDDTFAVTITNTTRSGFSAVIRRVSTNQEFSTWGQPIQLNWFAIERDDVYNGQIRVGPNHNHFDCIRTTIPMKFSTATGDVHVIVTPQMYGTADETFTSIVREIRTKSRAIEVVTRRVCDQISKGWSQELILNYSFITKSQSNVMFSSTVNIGSNRMKENLRKTVSIPTKYASSFYGRTPIIMVAPRSDPLAPKDDTFAVSLKHVTSSSFEIVARRTSHEMYSTWDQNLVIDCIILSSTDRYRQGNDMGALEQQMNRSLSIHDNQDGYGVSRSLPQQQAYSNYQNDQYFDDYQYNQTAPSYRTPVDNVVQPDYYPATATASNYDNTYNQQTYDNVPHQPMYDNNNSQVYDTTANQTTYDYYDQYAPTTTSSSYTTRGTSSTFAEPSVAMSPRAYARPQQQQVIKPPMQSYSTDQTPYQPSTSSYIAPPPMQKSYPSSSPSTIPSNNNRYASSSSYASPTTYLQDNSYQSYNTGYSTTTTSYNAMPPSQPVQTPYKRPVDGTELITRLKALDTVDKKMNLVLYYNTGNDPRFAPFKNFEVGDVLAEFNYVNDKELALNTILEGGKVSTFNVEQVLDILAQFPAKYKLNILGLLAPKVTDLVNAPKIVAHLPSQYEKSQAKYLLGLNY